MLDRSIAARWAADSSFLDSIGHWAWFRHEMPAAIAAGAGADPVRIDAADLAKAFLNWVSFVDSVRPFEASDREDFAHFASGCLLHECLRAGAAHQRQAGRLARFEALTRTAVTVLDAWRNHAGVGPVADGVPDVRTPQWNSYVENCLEDSALAVAFLDQFTGREPVWEAPLAIELRPAMRRAAGLPAHRRAAGNPVG